MRLSKKQIKKWLRILHRDIGYFIVGIAVVYALSGFFLNHKNAFPSVKTERQSLQLPTGLAGSEFTEYFQKAVPGTSVINRIVKKGEILFYIENGKGLYNAKNGKVNYEKYKTRHFIRFVNQLHFNNKKGWPVIADIFIVLLLFLAVSGLFIVPGKNGFFKRGIWFMLAGILLVIAFIWIG